MKWIDLKLYDLHLKLVHTRKSKRWCYVLEGGANAPENYQAAMEFCGFKDNSHGTWYLPLNDASPAASTKQAKDLINTLAKVFEDSSIVDRSMAEVTLDYAARPKVPVVRAPIRVRAPGRGPSDSQSDEPSPSRSGSALRSVDDLLGPVARQAPPQNVENPFPPGAKDDLFGGILPRRAAAPSDQQIFADDALDNAATPTRSSVDGLLPMPTPDSARNGAASIAAEERSDDPTAFAAAEEESQAGDAEPRSDAGVAEGLETDLFADETFGAVGTEAEAEAESSSRSEAEAAQEPEVAEEVVAEPQNRDAAAPDEAAPDEAAPQAGEAAPEPTQEPARAVNIADLLERAREASSRAAAERAEVEGLERAVSDAEAAVAEAERAVADVGDAAADGAAADDGADDGAAADGAAAEVAGAGIEVIPEDADADEGAVPVGPYHNDRMGFAFSDAVLPGEGNLPLLTNSWSKLIALRKISEGARSEELREALTRPVNSNAHILFRGPEPELADLASWVDGHVRKTRQESAGTSATDYLEAINEKVSELYREKAEQTKKPGHFTGDTWLASPSDSVQTSRAIWNVLERLGFDKGQLLAINAGHGEIAVQSEPEHGIQFTLIESDPIEANAAAILRPDAVVLNDPPGQTDTPDASYRVVTVVQSNHDPIEPWDDFRKNSIVANPRASQRRMMEAADKVAHGGFVVAVLPTTFMDDVDEGARRAVAKNLDLVSAIRLPGAALEYATELRPGSELEVTSQSKDLLVMRRRAPGENANFNWINSVPAARIQAADPGVTDLLVNEHYERNPTLIFSDDATELAVKRCAVDPASLSVPAQRLLGLDLDDLPTHANYSIPVVEIPRCRFDAKEGYADHAAKVMAAVTEFCERLPENALQVVAGHNDFAEIVLDEAPPAARFTADREGSFVIHNNGVHQINDGAREPVNVRAAGDRVIRAMIPLRDAAYDVLRVMHESNDDDELAAAQEVMNDAYDAFVETVGTPLNAKRTAREFRTDPAYAMLLALENYDRSTEAAEKADIFRERTVGRPTAVVSADTPQEALAISMARYGRVSQGLMRDLLEMEWDDIADELQGEIFRNPDGGRWESASKYLSGDVRQKLELAERAAKADPSYNTNVEALKEVQPDWLPAETILAQMGATWIPVEDIKQFAIETFVIPEQFQGRLDIQYAPLEGRWSARLNTASARAMSETAKLEYGFTPSEEQAGAGINPIKPMAMLEKTLNQVTVEVSREVGADVATNRARREKDPEASLRAQATQTRLRNQFLQWLWQDNDRKQRLETVYNKKLNSFVEPSPTGEYLQFPGLARNITPLPNQRRGVARIIEQGNTLIGHCTGSGKSGVYAMAAMETKRMGVYAKPMIAVRNNTISDQAAKFMQFYPGARLLVVQKDDLKDKAARDRFLRRVANNTWDAVMVPHSALDRIRVSADVAEDFYQQKINALQAQRTDVAARATDDDHILLRRIDARIQTYLDKRQKERDDRDPGALTFEQLGVDAIFLDEAHEYKNAGVDTKLNVRGINTSESLKTIDLKMKLDYLTQQHGAEKGTVFLTATPITNTMAEIYTMMNYVKPSVLQDMNIHHFDAWVANHGEVVTSIEQDTSGQGYKNVARLARFRNVAEMVGPFRQIADIVTEDQIDVETPEMETRVLVSPRTEQFEQYCQTLIERGERAKDPDLAVVAEHHAFSIMNDYELAGLDMRTISDEFAREEDDRVSLAAHAIHQEYMDSGDIRGTQLVFCDRSVPGGTGLQDFNFYDALRDELIEMGIPANEIAFAQDAKTQDAWEAMEDATRAGRVRVLFGSTDKIGVGTNVQDRVVAIHNIDAPWRPDQMTQRIGRGKRQGNMNDEMRNYVYAREGQTKRFDLLRTKGMFTQQALSDPRTAARVIEEEPEFTMDEVIAMVSDNDDLMRKVRLDNEMKQVTIEMEQHARHRGAALSRLQAVELRIEYGGRTQDAIEAFIPRFEAATNAYEEGWQKRYEAYERDKAQYDADYATGLAEARQQAKEAGEKRPTEVDIGRPEPMAPSKFEMEVDAVVYTTRNAAREAVISAFSTLDTFGGSGVDLKFKGVDYRLNSGYAFGGANRGIIIHALDPETGATFDTVPVTTPDGSRRKVNPFDRIMSFPDNLKISREEAEGRMSSYREDIEGLKQVVADRPDLAARHTELLDELDQVNARLLEARELTPEQRRLRSEALQAMSMMTDRHGRAVHVVEPLTKGEPLSAHIRRLGPLARHNEHARKRIGLPPVGPDMPPPEAPVQGPELRP